MKELGEFIDKIGNEYELGDPWKFSKKSIGVIVPIITKNQLRRDYITYPEVKDDVNVIDSGSIDKLKIDGIDKSVFIKGGTIFSGVGTQSRSIEHSIVLDPNSKIDIDVKCVHASHGIHHGSRFEYKGVSPRVVRSALSNPNSYGKQSSVWNSVSSYNLCSRNMTGHVGNRVESEIRNDDLVGVRNASKRLGSKIEDILNEVPVFENQIGAIIIGSNGIEGIEMFDHQDSWKAQYKDVIESYDDVFNDEQSLFSIDETKINDFIIGFINKIKKSDSTNVGNNCFVIKFKGYIGEYVIHNNRIIHLFVMKYDEPTKNDQQSLQYQSFGHRPSGLDHIVGSLNNGPKTWSELFESSKVSTSTLSSRLKELEKNGFVKRTLRKNGSKTKNVYKLNDIK